MSIQAGAIMNAVVSIAQSLGKFDTVSAHEPKSAPAKTGVSVAWWISDFRPALTASGLASTTMRLEVMGRIYQSMLMEPADTVDLIMIDAADALLTSFIGGVQLGGLIRNVDIRGEQGEPLRCLPGYLSQDSIVFRTIDIYVPMLVNDVYAEGQ